MIPDETVKHVGDALSVSQLKPEGFTKVEFKYLLMLGAPGAFEAKVSARCATAGQPAYK